VRFSLGTHEAGQRLKGKSPRMPVCPEKGYDSPRSRKQEISSPVPQPNCWPSHPCWSALRQPPAPGRHRPHVSPSKGWGAKGTLVCGGLCGGTILPVPPVSAGVTESQNHRMVGVGRDLCGSPSPTTLLKQGHLQQAAQDLVQAGLEYL